MKTTPIKVLFIAHGKSNRLKKIEKQLLQNHFPEFQLIKTSKASEAVNIAYDNSLDYSHIVAIGGDGTLHEVINGVMGRIGEEKGPVIGFMPGGTANDFAKSLNFPNSINSLAKAIEANNLSSCDIGIINYHTESGEKKNRWFINIADAGIGAMVVNEVNLQPKLWGPNIAFFRAIIKSFRKYRNVPVHCEADEWKWEGRMKMIIAGNGKYFGSGLCIAPHAIVNDGKLAITIGADISTMDYIKYLPILKKGGRINHTQLFYKEARSLKITSSETCAIEADGEWLGYTPVEIKLLPQRLRFLTSSL